LLFVPDLVFVRVAEIWHCALGLRWP
jgi:hypothetical protein